MVFVNLLQLNVKESIGMLMAEHTWRYDAINGYEYCINCYMRKHWPGATDSCSVPKGLTKSVLGPRARKKVKESGVEDEDT